MMMELDESFQVEFWTCFILVLPRLSLYVSVSPSPPYLIGKLFQSFQVDVWLTKS